jgi:haloalkane dehalogenase
MIDVTWPDWLDREAYPFEHHVAETSAGRVHYVDEGHGAPILFVHGTPTWSFEYRHLIAALAPDHRCVAPDHLGFGLSERPAGFAYTPEAHAGVLAEFVDRLDLRDLTLILHYFGGPIGLPLALDTDRVRRVVLINTWAWPFDDDRDMLRKARIAGGWVGRLLYRHANVSLRVLLPGAYGDRRRLTPEIHRQYLEVFHDRDARVQVLHALARALIGSRDFYARLWRDAARLRDYPVLILWGMKDTAFRPALIERWRSAVPHATVVELPAAGHWPHEEDPPEVASRLRRFIDET